MSDSLQRLVDTLADRESSRAVKQDLESALKGFDATAARVAIRIYETQAGESAWGKS